MHLKQLKLAGFKSFVDPTIIPFPSQLVAVVGPNGCGKSNIIDAVRWVMGESSAKNLRGESMADVIFNGSSNRKAIGQASIELVFDNSMGRLTGQYASYQEIAVKRLVTRDGESSYFLNGARCRRRDITDIFLGTGAGARGYSIIGQGTISRLVEARPEELRAFLEEAAGISKYKERRRETITRINHTRENLARVADIREELNKQLQRLERQAKAAERYQHLKQEEKRYKIEILALKWHVNHQEQLSLNVEISQATLNYEQQQTLMTNAYNQRTQLREQWEIENTSFQVLQTDFYKLNTDIALLEENIQQQNREKQRLNIEQQQIQTEWQTLSSQVEQERFTLKEGEEKLASFQETRQRLLSESIGQQKDLESYQSKKAAWQEEWGCLQQALQNATREEQVEQVRLQHLMQQQQEMLLRLDKIQAELQQVEDELTHYQPGELKASLEILKADFQKNQQTHLEVKSENDSLRQQLKSLELDLRIEQENYHQIRMKETTLSALIDSALGTTTSSNHEQVLRYPRLIDQLLIEAEWQKACEVILGDNLKAYVVEDIKPFIADTSDTLILTTAKKKTAAKNDYPRLADKLQGNKPSFLPDFEKIFAASSLSEACEWLTVIKEDESIITKEGYWLGNGWFRYTKTKQETEGILAKQQELIKHQQLFSYSQEKLSHLKTQQEDVLLAINANDHHLTTAQIKLTQSREAISACEAEISAQERLLQQILTKKLRLAEEKEDLLLQREDKVHLQIQVEITLKTSAESRKDYEIQKEQLHAKKEEWESGLLVSQQALETVRVDLHQSELQLERQQLTLQQAQKNIAKDSVRLQNLTDRLEILAEQLLTFETPDSSLMTHLTEKLSKHREIELILNGKREQLEAINTSLENEEAQWKALEKQAKLTQEKIQQLQLHLQTLVVQASNFQESLQEFDVQGELILSSMPVETSIQTCEQALRDIDDKIKRLGAINLAAIEEYTNESQRKLYLDEQYQDLTEALNTLDAAIEKMDKETKQRLQQTFDEVNRSFQALFPRLFGGGRAMLELTCDNLLEAGVLVMAQPPGKRNSTIHLLSGGEKAMTAVALVFAIFQLNPSPFCMLDEVDAPLDDVNVGRFCALVKEMSQFVQFLFITHNKVTMELAEHLIGVTMHEPGVSRVVSVDVEQALALTEE